VHLNDLKTATAELLLVTAPRVAHLLLLDPGDELPAALDQLQEKKFHLQQAAYVTDKQSATRVKTLQACLRCCFVQGMLQSQHCFCGIDKAYHNTANHLHHLSITCGEGLLSHLLLNAASHTHGARSLPLLS
jgi:hypothetical protein